MPTAAPTAAATAAPTAVPAADGTAAYFNEEDPGTSNITPTILSRCTEGGKSIVGFMAQSYSTSPETVQVRLQGKQTELERFELGPKGKQEAYVATAPISGTVEFFRLAEGKPDELVGVFTYEPNACPAGQGVIAMASTHCTNGNAYFVLTAATNGPDEAPIFIQAPGEDTARGQETLEANGDSFFVQGTEPEEGTAKFSRNQLGNVFASLGYKMLRCA